MKCKTNIGALLVAVVLLATAATTYGAQAPSPDAIAGAKALYDAAEYEAALAALDRIPSNTMTREQTRDRALYRALCFLALNRRAAAASALETLVQDDPLFRLAGETMPPRLHSLLEEVRVRLAPSVAQQRYQAGRKHFDAKEYQKALEEFTLAIQILEDIGEGADPALADTKVLAAGFRDLAQRSIEPQKPAAAPPAPSAATASPASPAEPNRPEVVVPVPISRRMPEFPPRLVTLTVTPVMDGVVEVLIAEDGTVKSANLVKRVHPVYDPLLLEAAAKWKYQPATRDGKPIEFLKRIAVIVRLK